MSNLNHTENTSLIKNSIIQIILDNGLSLSETRELFDDTISELMDKFSLQQKNTDTNTACYSAIYSQDIEKAIDDRILKSLTLIQKSFEQYLPLILK